MAAIEAFGQPQNGGERLDDAAPLARQLAVVFVVALWCAAAVVARDQRDGVHFFGLEAAEIAVLDQIVRVLVVAFVADVRADIMEQRRVLEPFAFAIGQAVDAARLLEQGEREPRDLRGVFGPVVASFGQLDDAAAADVRVAIGLCDLLAVSGDVIENQPFAQ